MRRLALASAMLLGVAAVPARADSFAEHIDTVDVFAGLGVGGFNHDLGTVTSSGLAWNIRVGVDAYRYIGAELNYQGIAPAADTFIRQGAAPLSGSHVTGNEFSIDARAGYPFLINDHTLRPYALLGIGFEHIGIDQSLNAVGMSSDTAFAVPLGIGVSYNIYDVWAVDARYTYNFLAGQRTDLAPSGDSWSLGLNIGARFGG